MKKILLYIYSLLYKCWQFNFHNQHAIFTDHLCGNNNNNKKHLEVSGSILYRIQRKCLFTTSSCTHVKLKPPYVLKISMTSITHMQIVFITLALSERLLALIHSFFLHCRRLAFSIHPRTLNTLWQMLTGCYGNEACD